MSLKIIDIDDKKYILTDDKHGVNIYGQSGDLLTDFRNQNSIPEKILEARTKYIEEKRTSDIFQLEQIQFKEYLTYNDDERESGFEYKITYLKYFKDHYYVLDTQRLDIQTTVLCETTEEIKNKLKQREERINKCYEEIENISAEFDKFVDLLWKTKK